FRPAPNPVLVQEYPQLYMGMGYTAEEVAVRWGVSREDQDAFALRSHLRTAAAIDGGLFDAEIVPVDVERWAGDDENGADLRREQFTFRVDEGVRRDTSLEALARLRPAFRQGGSVTAGNSSQLSDGAAAVVVMSARRAAALGLTPKAAYRSFAVGGVDPDVMGVGPTVAVPKALRLAGLRLEDVGLIELNEAFAAQSLEVMRELGMDEEIVNVNGGAIALGHPLGCTGARQTVTLLHEAARRKVRHGLVTMCIGGGMGAAGVFDFAA
ncbi:MAG: acetyl-CoA C-acyltransferase, partial [Chloroflexi bacterium]|nr:acetyl-CoA C-acyltransferase [Chloroflexota bacterium]